MLRIDSSRWRRLALSLALLGLAQGCSSDSTGPAAVASVTISGAPSTPLAVGETVTLGATPRDADGKPLTGRTVGWSSTQTGVATVSGDGVVRAVAAGTTEIVATSGSASQGVTIQVQAPASGCDEGGLTLGVGEVQQVDPRVDVAACLPAGGGEYVVVAFNGSTGPGSLALTVQGAAAAATTASVPGARASLVPRRDAALGPLGPRPDWAFEAGLRRRERAQLPRYLPAARAWKASRASSGALASAVPGVGDVLTLNFNLGDDDDVCANTAPRDARVAAVTDRAIVLNDATNPAGGFTDEEAREIGLIFDDLVYGTLSESFGPPADIDDNGRVLIFYTREVNERTPAASQEYVGGFFHGRDLFPRTQQEGFQACPGSNFAEMFYALAPDPTGAINQNKRSKEFVRSVTISTIAHEMKHLIGASRRLYVLDTPNYFDETWLEEGVAHIAQELVFYAAAGLGPEQNLGLSNFQGNAAHGEAFLEHVVGNMSSFRLYLPETETESPFDEDDDLATRGSAWAFLRYAADRSAADQSRFWRDLVNSELTGLENLQNALGTAPIPLARDWAVSVFTDEILPTAPEYQQPSWKYRELIGALFEDGYELRVRTLGSAPETLSLVGGGAAYLRVTTGAGAPTELQFRSGDAAPPSTLSVHVVRTK